MKKMWKWEEREEERIEEAEEEAILSLWNERRKYRGEEGVSAAKIE